MSNSENNEQQDTSVLEMSYGEKIAALQLENDELRAQVADLTDHNTQLLSLVRDDAQPAEANADLPIHVRPFPEEDRAQVVELQKDPTVVAAAGLRGGMQPDHVAHMIRDAAVRLGQWFGPSDNKA